MIEPSEREGAPKARGDEGDGTGTGNLVVDEDEHWQGYPGGEAATSYPVVDRGRYKLLLFLVALAFLGTAIAIATRQSENLPRDERSLTPK